MAVFRTRDIKAHGLRAYLALMDAGYDFAVLEVSPTARAKGHSSPDVLLEGHIWELKCPTGSNPKKTVSRNINRAIRQMLDADPPIEDLRVIISSLDTPLPDTQIEYQANRVLEETRERLVEILLIKKSGETVRLKKEAEA